MQPLTHIKQMAAALALCALTACGGGGGAPAPAHGNNSGSTGSGGPTPSTLAPGIYVDTANDLSVALLTGSGSSRPWYGLRKVKENTSSDNSQIYAGDLNGPSTSFVGGVQTTVTATVTAASTTSFSGGLVTASTNVTITSATQPSPLALSDLSGNWPGVWTVGADAAAYTSGAGTLVVSGASVSTVSAFLGCTMAATLTQRSEAEGLFDLTPNFSNSSTCKASGALTGLLMAYQLGGKKQLRIVAINAPQSASFRSVQP